MDPFTGLGSTAVACARLGVNFIGVGIDETYLEEAVERTRDASRAMTKRARRARRAAGAAKRGRAGRRQLACSCRYPPTSSTTTWLRRRLEHVFLAEPRSTRPCASTFTSIWRRRFVAIGILRVVPEHVVVARLGVDPLQRLVEVVLVDDGDAAGLLGDARAGCPATCARTRSTAADRPARRCRPSADQAARVDRVDRRRSRGWPAASARRARARDRRRRTSRSASAAASSDRSGAAAAVARCSLRCSGCARSRSARTASSDPSGRDARPGTG